MHACRQGRGEGGLPAYTLAGVHASREGRRAACMHAGTTEGREPDDHQPAARGTRERTGHTVQPGPEMAG